MMTWYIVQTDPDIYHCLNIADQADCLMVNFFWGYEHLKNPSIPEVYVSVDVELELREQEGDFPCPPCSLPTFTLTDKTKDLLNSIISDCTILLPIMCGSKTLYIVRPEDIACLDYSRSVVDRYSNGAVRDVEKFYFVKEDLVGKHIFRLPEIKRYTFVSSQFKQCVESNNLTGLIFREIV
jgi:hypothetical protein